MASAGQSRSPLPPCREASIEASRLRHVNSAPKRLFTLPTLATSSVRLASKFNNALSTSSALIAQCGQFSNHNNLLCDARPASWPLKSFCEYPHVTGHRSFPSYQASVTETPYSSRRPARLPEDRLPSYEYYQSLPAIERLPGLNLRKLHRFGNGWLAAR